MEPRDFVSKFLPFARETEKKTGISAVAILAQAALESAWGDIAPGNMFFGVKDTDGINGNEQLITTTEYSRSATLKFPKVISVTPVMVNGIKMFKYKVKDYFRRYETPEESFTDHAKLFLRVKRYAKAMTVKNDPIAFVEAVAKAGYGTGPEYADTMRKLVKMIQRLV